MNLFYLTNQQTQVILDLCLRKSRSEEYHDYHDAIVFEKLSKCFLPHENANPAFLNFSSLKIAFEKLRSRDRLVWTIDLAVEVKLRFQISAA